MSPRIAESFFQPRILPGTTTIPFSLFLVPHPPFPPYYTSCCFVIILSSPITVFVPTPKLRPPTPQLLPVPASLVPSPSPPPATYPAPPSHPVPQKTERSQVFHPALTPEELNEALSKELHKHVDDIPPEIPVQSTIGKLMQPRPPFAVDHEAIPLLHAYAEHGCPVDCGEDWTLEHIELMLRRGPHKSSKAPDAIQVLREETADKIKHGYARTVRWGDIKKNWPKRLKISPIAMIPHKSKKFRAILDLSFRLRHKGFLLPSVNSHTVCHAKREAMAQLGLALRRLVVRMAEGFDPANPFLFAKLDIKDGFWRMAVNDDDAWNFCYVLPSLTPTSNLDDVELVVPNSLQMGWCESPPYFCSGTETARDIIERMFRHEDLPPHYFEKIMMRDLAEDKLPSTPSEVITELEVFVDDFIAATNCSDKAHLQQISRAMLHGIHSIFPPPHVSGHNGFDPVSEKKLHEGEGVWSHHKEILGWEFDGLNYTIKLPDKKCDAIVAQLRKLLGNSHAKLNDYQKIAGKLQHASFGIPGGAGLFSPIQAAMIHDPPFITLTPDLKEVLKDWRSLIQQMKTHPTSVLQLAVDYPKYIGYSDACGLGCGGVWCSGTSPLDPILWRFEWPEDIKAQLITDDNPNGTLTINDLELAGLVINWLVLECQGDLDLAFSHVGTFCDNTSAVAWAYKLRQSTSVIAGRLLRFLGLRIHKRKSSGLTPLHIAGEDNDMADIISRTFKTGKFFHASQNLLDYFNSNFPLPQKKSWREFQPPKKLLMRVISCLQDQPLPMAQLLRLPGIEQNTGPIGNGMLPTVGLTRSSKTKASPTSNKTPSSAALLQGCGRGLTVEELQSKFRPSRTRSRPSPRPSSWLDNKVPSTKKANKINMS